MSTLTIPKEISPKSTARAPRAAQPAPDEQGIARAVSNLKLLADPTRIRILLILSESERNVTTLCGLLSQGQPAVSHHLALLRVSGMAEADRRGKNIFYAATPMGRKAMAAARVLMA